MVIINGHWPNEVLVWRATVSELVATMIGHAYREAGGETVKREVGGETVHVDEGRGAAAD